ncbi:DUF1735 domain-containing protein [Gramella sp. MT6]|uniref:DUF1735 domain-containing protein n=1 Tax=Gramella sp. MT6 TaxID=2705471 RepID=UPI001C5FC50F|nr:DUF1735 domain-containing protein [Gramella sp. MT6]QYA25327.1 DUF1735 domain-containing protein [Gramella sp. MT6]
MKKFFNLFFVLAAFSLVVVGCDYDDDMEPLSYVTFGETSGEIAVPQNGGGSFDVSVYTGNVTGSDRTFDVMVAESSTLPADSYSVPATVTIPANSNEASITVDFTDTSISNAGNSLVLSIESTPEVTAGDPLAISVSRDCPSELEGTYSVLTSGQSTDGAAPDPVVDLPYTVTLTKTGTNKYTVSDIFAGIYIDWYCDAYEYCVDTEATITDVCGNLSSTFEEPFGTETNVTGTVNADGTLTISFENGYGDTATSVYTKM